MKVPVMAVDVWFYTVVLYENTLVKMLWFIQVEKSGICFHSCCVHLSGRFMWDAFSAITLRMLSLLLWFSVSRYNSLQTWLIHQFMKSYFVKIKSQRTSVKGSIWSKGLSLGEDVSHCSQLPCCLELSSYFFWHFQPQMKQELIHKQG